VSVHTLTLGAPAAVALRLARPAVLSLEPIDPETVLGQLFAPTPPARRARGERAPLQDALDALAPALDLLPTRELRRAETLAAWCRGLFGTAHEGDRVERRVERLHRSAYLVARALAGEPVASPFARRLAAESARRQLPRRALDTLLAAARRAARQPLASTPADWEVRSREIAEALVAAMLGATPTPSTCDAAAGLLRLACLLAVPDALRVRRFHLPVEEPPTLAGTPPEPEMARAITDECEAVHQLLLRGARGVGEVPLTFRATLAALLALALRLLGRIEEHPERLFRQPVQLGRLEAAWVLWRIRREPIA
jgi:phytoene/squalene synthetase